MNTAPPAAKALGGMPASKGGSIRALSGIVGIVLGFVVGYGVGRVSTGTPINPLSGSTNGVDPAALAEVQQKLIAAGLLTPLLENTPVLSGKIVAISGSSLTLEADLSRYDPLGAKGLPTRRIVTLTDKTEYARYEQLSAEELRKEQEAFDASLRNPEPGVPPRQPPAPFRQTEASSSDLKIGDAVTVQAAGDILSAESFEAVRVSISPQPIAEQVQNAPPDMPEPPPPTAPDSAAASTEPPPEVVR